MQALIVNLTDKKVVLAGGGRIAARKVKVLADQQVEITVVAPDFNEEILELSRQRNVRMIKRKAQPEDFEGAFLAIIATSDRNTNKSLASQLLPDQLVCVVDEGDEGNVTFPATIKRGHLQIAVTTNGASPKLTRKLKGILEKQFDHSWVDYSEFLKQVRNKLKVLHIPQGERLSILEEILEESYRIDPFAQSEILARLNKYAVSGNK